MHRAASPTPTDSMTTSAPAERRSRWRRLARWAVYLVLALAAIWVLQSGVREIQAHDWQFDPPSIVVAILFWIVATVGAAFCWLVVARAFGIRLPLGHGLKVFCTSNLGKYLPGKVLHVVARLYLVQEQGVGVSIGTSSILLDVLLYIGAGMTLATLALPTALEPLLVTLRLDTRWAAYWPAMMAVAGLALLFGLALLHPRPLNAILDLVGRHVARFRGVRIDLDYATILKAFALYLLLWCAMAAAVFATVRAVYPAQLTDAPLIGAVFALAYVAGLFGPTPAGGGTRELVLAVLFGASGIPWAAAIVASILARLLQIVAEAICAGALSLVYRD